jgi:hypothetical protein
MRFLIQQGGVLVVVLGIGMLFWNVEQQVGSNTAYLISGLVIVLGVFLYILLNRLYE